MANPNIKTANSFLAKPLAQGQHTGTAATTLYSVPTDVATKITAASLTNTSAQAVTISVHLTPTGIGSVSAPYAILSNYVLAANDTIRLPEIIGGIYVAGARVWLTPSAANAISYSLHGLEIS